MDANDALVNAVREDFFRRRQARRKHELQWLLNMDFMGGEQYRAVTPRGEVEEQIPDYRWERREVFNHVAPIIETRLAKLARLRPTMSVRAATGDANDLATAGLSTRILKGALANAGLSRAIAEACRWSEIAGTCFYKIVWNQGLGRPLARVEEEGEEGLLREGEVEISAVPPFELYPYSDRIPELSDQPSLLHARACPVEEIALRYGARPRGESLNVYTLKRGGQCGDEIMEDAALVIEKYEAPTSAEPEGRLTIVGGELLLYSGPLPYLNGAQGERGYPFARQCALKLPGLFWGVSVIERLIPVQRAYNAVKNRKYEMLNRVTMGVVAVEDGSVDTDNLEEEGLSPGKILVYRQGSRPPAELIANSVPPDFSREEDRLLNEFILISGVSELMRSSRGYAENVSGVALQLLAEQDDTRLLSTVDEVRQAVRETGRQVLRLYKQFAQLPRLLRIGGENGEVEILHFTASDITSDDLAFDTENELADTPAQRRSMALELLAAGLLYDSDGKLPLKTRNQLLDLMGFSALAAGEDGE